ncbi:ABC transporter ATP-binding protein [Bifidobacterium gallicum]|uniref:Sulfonate ABC transporter, ATP-binding subunit SsuB n=1 Tax=Bifidobacterium gallicum DSM 20093 = LMG 11596 TaxID=561180 RepID=A0A087AEM0_9BIFI|nr:ABC transporter ATP-binding protein [Bifidobacterium gallicum]KFI57220.1 sulfonate ABC transporter, ATP-binding subunit SsuB [Bifidobacterium gallicum DSM 20093 = LMG 11596]
MGHPQLRLSQGTVHFAGASSAVLNSVDLDVPYGTVTALLGRSGCGKSTLLRVLCGLQALHDGQIETRGHILPAFQEPRLVPWQRLWRNLTLGLPGTRHQLRQQAADALEEVGLSGRHEAWPKELSGGQAQRASLARALLRRPDFLLLDEPFGALDALTRLDMQDLLMATQRHHGFGVLLVTHDIAEAVRLSDTVLVLDHGAICHQKHLDRTELDDAGRPRNHAAVEDDLRSLLRG